MTVVIDKVPAVLAQGRGGFAVYLFILRTVMPRIRCHWFKSIVGFHGTEGRKNSFEAVWLIIILVLITGIYVEGCFRKIIYFLDELEDAL